MAPRPTGGEARHHPDSIKGHYYAIASPKGMAYVRGKPQALARARDLVGAMPQVTETDLRRFWDTVIERTSEEHAKRHGL